MSAGDRMGQAREHVRGLLDRVHALQRLLACYRTGVTPSQSLYVALDKSRDTEALARAWLDLQRIDASPSEGDADG